MRELVTDLAGGTGAGRGIHAGEFRWRGTDAVVEGQINGMTNVGTHREPVFDPCQTCHDPGYMEGRLIGKVVRARDERLLGTAITAAYRITFDPTEGFQSTGIEATIEGALAVPCDGGDPGQVGPCLNLSSFAPANHPNPWRTTGHEFSVFDFDGSPTAHASIVDWTPHKGLNTGYRTDISLPAMTSSVSITLIHFSSPATVRAFNSVGALVDAATMTVANVPETLTLAGAGIVRLVVDAPNNECLILEICP
ncbi:MAG: hypothetical protein AAF567_23655 [Actinomycetota bacterium]